MLFYDIFFNDADLFFLNEISLIHFLIPPIFCYFLMRMKYFIILGSWFFCSFGISGTPINGWEDTPKFRNNCSVSYKPSSAFFAIAKGLNSCQEFWIRMCHGVHCSRMEKIFSNMWKQSFQNFLIFGKLIALFIFFHPKNETSTCDIKNYEEVHVSYFL